MPRRWHQVGGSISAGDGGKQARSPGRARRKPLKPLRGGCRVKSGVTVVTMLVCFFILHARLRARRAPGIPCSLLLVLGRNFGVRTRAPAARSRSCVCERCCLFHFAPLAGRGRRRSVAKSPCEGEYT